MVGAIGFEPTTSWSQTRRSTRLSYTPQYTEQNGVVLGLEPRLGANLARTVYKAVGATLHYTTKIGGAEGIRTPNQSIMSALL